MSGDKVSPANFKEYFPIYMAAHSKQGTRWLHAAATLTGAGFVAIALIRRKPLLVPVGAASLFTLAWIGHFGVERNAPAGFRNPVRALPGDLLLTGLVLTGRRRRLDELSRKGRDLLANQQSA